MRLRVRFLATVLVTVVAASVGALAVSTPSSAAPGASFQNPIVGTPNSADPWLGYHNGNYYYTATTWTGNIFIRRASTLGGLRTAPETRVFTMSQPNATSNMWAPSMHLLNGPNGQRWYLYYSAGPSACCSGQRQHVLESAGTDPMGPYTYRGQLNLMPNNGWSIDGSVMTVSGVNYFVFSAFNNNSGFDNGGLQSLYITRLTNPWTPAALGTLISEPTLSWERQGNPVNEGPYVLQRGGRTFLTYSASYCGTPDYKVGALELTGANPLSRSSWTKLANPLFQRNDANGVYGPAHHSFFTSPDGTEDWIVYHANSSSSQGCGTTRTSRAQRISWNPDGTPHLGVPVSTSTVLAGPSGELNNAGAVPVQRLQSFNFQDRYVRHQNYAVRIDPNVNPALDGRFRVVSGLANNGSGYVSFESENFPGYYLRHNNYVLRLEPNNGSTAFREDATFRQVAGLANSSWSSFQSYNFPDRYVRHSNYVLRIDPISNDTGRADATFRRTS
ncbi:family 43 glycosylhydrolase [Micromonospora sp. WMMD1082]|uniref:family 43 glycosylhydrolase n=1 Tax=Micromonospora sp. WMMD1082 TaxID=3016104 RepID=UPI002417FFE9|nr:family 43 glycosylhydrolase [Micromonospora sp. WMMD1082]MDG4794267.1 family 43 glycosylhydrolase [Micromonospora sp. WMMD1082]